MPSCTVRIFRLYLNSSVSADKDLTCEAVARPEPTVVLTADKWTCLKITGLGPDDEDVCCVNRWLFRLGGFRCGFKLLTRRFRQLARQLSAFGYRGSLLTPA